MKRTIYTLLVMLMCTAGAWAEGTGTKEDPYTGEIGPGVIKEGVYLSQDCKIKASSDNYVETVVIYDTKLSSTPVKEASLSQSTIRIGDFLDDNQYNNYKTLSGDISDRLFVVTEFSQKRVYTTYEYIIKGHFEGFYTVEDVLADIDRIAGEVKAETGYEITNAVDTYKDRIDRSKRFSYDDVRFYYCEFIKVYNEMMRLRQDYLAQIADDNVDPKIKAVLNKYLPLLFASKDMNSLRSCHNNCMTEVNQIVYRYDAIAELRAIVGSRTDEVLLEMRDDYIARMENEVNFNTFDIIFQEARTELTLKCAKIDAVQALSAAIVDVDDDYQLTVAQKYMNSIEDAYNIDKVDALRTDALQTMEEIVHDPSALCFNFGDVDGRPLETHHALETVSLTFGEDGETINLSVNGATVTYPFSLVAGITAVKAEPKVTLHPNENPDNQGHFYTTFYSGLEAYTLPEGVEAYTGVLEEEGEEVSTIRLVAVEGGILPRGEAVVLHTQSAGDIEMKVSTIGGELCEENVFEGYDVCSAQPEDSKHYMFSYGQHSLAFYKMAATMPLPANKALIAKSTTSPTKAYRLQWTNENNEATAIDKLAESTEHGTVIYNIAGQRLSRMQKGVNIVNGRKLIVK